MGLCLGRREDAQTIALAKSTSLPVIAGDLSIKRSLPDHDYIQQLIKDFCKSSSPECIPRVVFGPDKTLSEFASASYHLPGAYVDYFPCPHCTYKDEERRTSFVEVFHFPNFHKPNFCVTVAFVMPADAVLLQQPAECSIEVKFTMGCPNAPISVDHSPRVELHVATDVFIEMLRFMPRSELEKMMLVSRRWSDIIGGAAASLQQRRRFTVMPKFYGESPGMLSVHFGRTNLGQRRILRVLTTRGLSQALNAVRSHLRNAFFDILPFFMDRVARPCPPGEMLVNIPLAVRIDWLKSLLRSMPPTSEIRSWRAVDTVLGFTNLLTLASCALEPHRQLGCVQALGLGLLNGDATWTQLTSLLNHPRIRGFSEISFWTTRAAIDTYELRDILSSRHSLKLHVSVVGGVEPQDSLLTLPTQIIQDFVALRDVDRFVAEFSLHLIKPDNTEFSEMPDVDEDTDRRKRFRYHLQGEDTVVRVSIYENPTARKHLTVVTFDHFRRSVLFLNGNVSLAQLKHILQRPYAFY
ncbi:hypothetical protein AAVH_16115 [Aphelenchoides avenae]|nr:hypothetical protein AAVH_16115 [Aphelenchus avenae]